MWIDIMRKADLYILFLMISVVLVILASIHAAQSRREGMPLLLAKGEMIRDFGLTDLCLFTEASYTRHLSQADSHTPFQDYPMSLEHFPSGSMLSPPGTIKRPNGKVD
jgi:hypothetical protein